MEKKNIAHEKSKKINKIRRRSSWIMFDFGTTTFCSNLIRIRYLKRELGRDREGEGESVCIGE